MNAILYDTQAPTKPMQADTSPLEALVDGTQLANALKVVSGAAVKRHKYNPILDCVLISTPGTVGDVAGHLRVTATNLDVSISAIIPCVADGGFRVAVPAKLTRDTVKPKAETYLTADRRTLSIKQDRKTNTIKSLDPADFPLVPTSDDLPLAAVVPLSLLKRARVEVAPFCSTDTNREQLASVYMEVTDSGTALFVAADGYRMSLLGGRVSDDSPTPATSRIMIPAKAFAELDVIDSPTVRVYITPDRKRVIFAGDTVEVGIHLTEGKYINFMRIIEQVATSPGAARFMCMVDDILAVNKVLLPFAKEGGMITVWDYEDSDDPTLPAILTMSASALEVGDCLGRIDAYCQPAGKKASVALNHKYVSDTLKPHKKRRVVVEIADDKPAIFRIDDDLMMIVMPLNIKGK